MQVVEENAQQSVGIGIRQTFLKILNLKNRKFSKVPGELGVPDVSVGFNLIPLVVILLLTVIFVPCDVTAGVDGFLALVPAGHGGVGSDELLE